MYKKIKELCNEKRITIYALEKKLGFSNCSIKKWEKTVPAVDKLKAVADYFNVSIDYFLETEGE